MSFDDMVLTKKDLAAIAILFLIVGAVSVWLGLHGYRFYLNQFVGYCVEGSAECMVPIIN